MEYLNRERIERYDESFQDPEPYPWADIDGIFTPEGHELLRQSLPDSSMFEAESA